MSLPAQAEISKSTRQRLVDAAWAIVRDEGLRAATSRRIAADAGANLGAITYYFGSKNALLACAAVARMAVWMDPLAGALLDDEGDGGHRTETVIASLFDTFGTSRADARALLEVLIAGRDLPEATLVIRTALGRFQHVVADLMVRQQQRGEIPATVAPNAMSGLFTAFALGLMVQDITGTNPAPAPEIVGQLLSLLVTPPRPRSGRSNKSV